MDSSSYFELRESSDLLKGQILFSYTSLKSGKGYKYPVFLIFNSERIDFYFNGVIKKKQTEDENKVDNYPEFVENHLFSLNLHKGKGNVLKLGDSLRDLFDKKFPVIEDFFIYKGKENRHHHKSHITYAELKEFQNIKKKKDKKQTEDANKVDIHPEFVEMPPFSLNLYKGKENVLKSSTENKEKEDEKNVGEKLSYKKLLLDFLFDVYHSDVFENDPTFTLIKQHLDEIPFIQAIKRKAEFYYQVENNKIGENLITFDSSNSHYIDNLANAQEDWLEIIQEEGNHIIINKENKWFEDVETEVKYVFAKQFKIRFIKQKKNLHSNKTFWKSYQKFLMSQKFKSVKWFFKRNNVIDAWNVFTKTKYFGLFIFFLIDLYVTDIVLLTENKTYSSFGPVINILLIVLLIVFGLNSIIFVIINIKLVGLLFKQTLLILFEFTMISFLILLLTSAFLSAELTSYGNKYLIFLNELSYHGLLLPFLLLIINLIAFILLCYYICNYFKNIIKNSNNLKLKRNIIKLFFLLTGSVLFILFFNDLKKIPVVTTFINAIHITFVNLITLYSDSSNIFSSPNIFFNIFLFSLILLSIIFWILFIDEKKNHPKLSLFTSFKKVLSLLLVGLIFSFFANLLVLNFEYKDFLEKYNFIDEIWKSAVDSNKNSFKELTFDTSNVKNIKKIKRLLEEKESARVDAEKEEYFYTSLGDLEIKKNGKNLYPVLKIININGVKIITLPSVLYINTFLSLLLAVLIQVVLNHKKFLEGGKT